MSIKSITKKIYNRFANHFYHVSRCKNLKKEVILSGGVFSNHIHLVIDGTYSIGKDCSFQSDGIDTCKAQILILFGGDLTIGNNSGFAQSSIICTKSIKIGNNVKIGAGCLIMDSNFHSLNYIQRRLRSTDSINAKQLPVVIEDDVFIGARCIINKGVHIGARTIICSGSVVISNIPADCIAGGNPCKVIKKINIQ